MKKEYFVFLILILAAAIVTGSTLGLLSNFKYISQQSKTVQQQQNTIETKNDSLNKSSSDQTQSTSKESEADNSEQKLALNGADTAVVISEIELDEINAMLDAVELSKEKDYAQRIKDFQEKNSLPGTGIIDTRTLNVLINQVTLQKAIQRLDG